MREFAKERGVNWSRYYDKKHSYGVVPASDSIAIPTGVRKFSQEIDDKFYIQNLDGTITVYTLVGHDKLGNYRQGIARSRNNLIFNEPFTVDSREYGGELIVPSYLWPTPITNDTDDIDIDDADWLVFTVAADRVKNDVTRRNLKADLVAQANERMLGLKEEELSQIEDVSRPWNPTSIYSEDW